jgi:hypothetical protein
VPDHQLDPHQPAAAQPVAPIQPVQAGAAWVQSFNDRYGSDAYHALLQAFEKPCVSYAEMAVRFGVTRERVRQWHLLLLPDAPRGHERRRLCRSYQQKRRLLTDPLFRAFVRAARPSFPSLAIGPIPARDGFRKRTVRLAAQTVVLKQAPRAHQREGSQTRAIAYALTSSRGGADFIFYQLSGEDFLFVPKTLIPLAGTTFLDSSVSKYQQFKNTFRAAVLPDLGSGDAAERKNVTLRSQAG